MNKVQIAKIAVALVGVVLVGILVKGVIVPTIGSYGPAVSVGILWGNIEWEFGYEVHDDQLSLAEMNDTLNQAHATSTQINAYDSLWEKSLTQKEAPIQADINKYNRLVSTINPWWVYWLCLPQKVTMSPQHGGELIPVYPRLNRGCTRLW